MTKRKPKKKMAVPKKKRVHPVTKALQEFRRDARVSPERRRRPMDF